MTWRAWLPMASKVMGINETINAKRSRPCTSVERDKMDFERTRATRAQ